MTHIETASETRSDVSVVVIGRNEGEQLRAALSSLPMDRARVVYVDSGSSDGSPELARGMGAAVHELSSDRPFSPARGRREGVDYLLTHWPEVQWIQFLDGDCELADGWLEQAVAYFQAHEDVALVCGQLAEKAPQRSIYNRVAALQWQAPPGPINACGGIFMIRRDVYEAAGGFNSALLTREEEELCARVRQAGHELHRLDIPMARHDSNLLRFSQWWARAVWGGYGAAIAYHENASQSLRQRLAAIHERFFWPAVVPGVGVAGLLGMAWWNWLGLVPVLCALAYIALLAKITRDRLGMGDGPRDAALYALLCVLRKFAVAAGFASYYLKPDTSRHRPDPHAPPDSSSSSVTASSLASSRES